MYKPVYSNTITQFTFQKVFDLKSLMAAENLIHPWIGAIDILGNNQFIFIGSGVLLDEHSSLWATGGYLAPTENWGGGSLAPQPYHTSDTYEYDCAFASEPWDYDLVTYKCSVADTFICEKYDTDSYYMNE